VPQFVDHDGDEHRHRPPEQEHRAATPAGVSKEDRDRKKGNSIRTGIGPMRKRATVGPDTGPVPSPYDGAWY
jgi:hypothetical protein